MWGLDWDAGADKARAGVGGMESKWAEKTKGHRVIAMPLCLADLAPPAFTAPCRNQINELASLKGKRRASRVSSENSGIAAAGSTSAPRLCPRSYNSVSGGISSL